MYLFFFGAEFEEPEDFRGTIETLVNSEKLLVPRILHKPNDIFEVPRIPHKPNDIFEDPRIPHKPNDISEVPRIPY